MDYTNWRHWAHGLLGATIGGGANAISLMIVSPETYNLAEGWKKLAEVTIVSMIVSAALYIKTSPLPQEVVEVNSDGVKK